MSGAASGLDPRLDPRAGDVLRDATGTALDYGEATGWRVWVVLAVEGALVVLAWVSHDGRRGMLHTTRRQLAAGWVMLEALYVVPE